MTEKNVYSLIFGGLKLIFREVISNLAYFQKKNRHSIIEGFLRRYSENIFDRL